MSQQYLLSRLTEYAAWYTKRFGTAQPHWYVFPGRVGKPQDGRKRPFDPERPISTLKTSWKNLRERTGVQGRFHDTRHTLITELAESGAGDQTIMDIAGHVSRQMLGCLPDTATFAWKPSGRHWKASPPVPGHRLWNLRHLAQKRAQKNDSIRLGHKSGHSRPIGALPRELEGLQVIDWVGSSGRIRTYNPSVNSSSIAFSTGRRTSYRIGPERRYRGAYGQ
jgi:hypothetical protein